MTREEFERRLNDIDLVYDEALEVYRLFSSTAPTMSAKVLLLEKSERVIKMAKLLMLESDVTVAMSINNAVNKLFLPPRIDIRASLLNWDNHR